MKDITLKNDEEDEEIIKLLYSRHEYALEKIWRKYERFCRSIAPGIVREDFEECFDDMLMRLWNTIPPEQPQCLQTYIGTILRGFVIDRLRANECGKRGGRKVNVPLREAEELFDLRDLADAGLNVDTVARLVRKYLDKLPRRKRWIFLKHFWYLVPVDEIAEEYSMNPNTVKSILHRSQERLKKFLRENDVEI